MLIPDREETPLHNVCSFELTQPARAARTRRVRKQQRLASVANLADFRIVVMVCEFVQTQSLAIGHREIATVANNSIDKLAIITPGHMPFGRTLSIVRHVPVAFEYLG